MNFKKYKRFFGNDEAKREYQSLLMLNISWAYSYDITKESELADLTFHRLPRKDSAILSTAYSRDLKDFYALQTNFEIHTNCRP